jgi:hypothetical protein
LLARDVEHDRVAGHSGQQFVECHVQAHQRLEVARARGGLSLGQLLRAFVAVGEIEQWVAAQPWEAIPGGWRVRGQLHAWRFQVLPVAGGVRVVMSGIGGSPADWIVPAR